MQQWTGPEGIYDRFGALQRTGAYDSLRCKDDLEKSESEKEANKKHLDWTRPALKEASVKRGLDISGSRQGTGG